MNISDKDVKELMLWLLLGGSSEIEILLYKAIDTGISLDKCMGEIIGQHSREEKIEILKNMIIKKRIELYLSMCPMCWN